MAYCESAQRECRYLEDLQLVSEMSTLISIDPDSTNSMSIGSAEVSDAVQPLTSQTKGFVCDQAYCEIIGHVIRKSFIIDARTQLMIKKAQGQL